ncbi:hypothetical protein [uncultured Sulfitobacter sp.]|uniref:hypothetical protein n=1 Tax=uncultured Sulfitobacter sp. TaxID=191468 RepID=UPI002639FC1E|nr:hypothetical protein [uncultured Sulfitobacter sp.]
MQPLKTLCSEFIEKYGTAVGFCSLTLVGLGLYLFGHFHAPTPVGATSNLIWYAQLAFDLGRMILIGAILGAFVRFLHTFKAIREVVTDVFFGDEILKRRKDIDEIWAKLSKHIFIPDFSNENGLSGDLQERIVEQLKQGMQHNKTFYVRSSDRTITVKWADADNNIVEITDSSIEEFIPFQKGGNVHWKHVFSAGDNAKSADYSPEFSVVIDGENIEPLVDKTTSDVQVTYSYNMEGKDLYKVSKRSVRRWNLEADPLIVFVSRHIVESLRLEINCLDDNLRPFFEEHHLNDKFFVQPNDAGEARPSDYVTRCTSPILPGDGFTIALIKIG